MCSRDWSSDVCSSDLGAPSASPSADTQPAEGDAEGAPETQPATQPAAAGKISLNFKDRSEERRVGRERRAWRAWTRLETRSWIQGLGVLPCRLTLQRL